MEAGRFPGNQQGGRALGLAVHCYTIWPTFDSLNDCELNPSTFSGCLGFGHSAYTELVGQQESRSRRAA